MNNLGAGMVSIPSTCGCLGRSERNSTMDGCGGGLSSTNNSNTGDAL